MAKSLPPLTWFRAFEAAARSLSFTAAADEIGMTQSAVSQHVKSLETRLRVSLFTRHARGLSLTDDGRRLLPQVDAALAQLTSATEIFDAGTTKNQLNIAASVSVIQWILSPNLADFSASRPDVKIRFQSTTWPDEFLHARADVEIRFGSEKQVGSNAQLLIPNDLIAVKSPDLSGRIEDLPLIETVGTSSGWKAWGEKAGLICRPSVFADSFGVALQLAADQNGVALVSEFLTSNALLNGLLERAHPQAIESQEGYYLWANESDQAALDFRDWLLQSVSFSPS